MSDDDLADLKAIIEPILRASTERCAEEAERYACTDPCDHLPCLLRLDIAKRIREMSIEIVSVGSDRSAILHAKKTT